MDWWTSGESWAFVCGNIKPDKPVKRRILETDETRVRIAAAPYGALAPYYASTTLNGVDIRERPEFF